MSVKCYIAVSLFILAERHILASLHRRQGPSCVGGFISILQPVSDAIKLFYKVIKNDCENIINATIAVLTIFTFCSFLFVSISITYVYGPIVSKSTPSLVLQVISVLIILEFSFLILLQVKNRMSQISLLRLISLAISVELVFLLLLCSLVKYYKLLFLNQVRGEGPVITNDF